MELTDLSKAFDCIDHTLLIARLSAFGVSPLSLKLLYSYLSNRTQPIKINGNFSDRTDIEFDVPQGSILGPILFNINLIDLFLRMQRFQCCKLCWWNDTVFMHCVKSVPIRSYFWSVFFCIRTRNKSVFGHFLRSVVYLYSLYLFIRLNFIFCWTSRTR